LREVGCTAKATSCQCSICYFVPQDKSQKKIDEDSGASRVKDYAFLLLDPDGRPVTATPVQSAFTATKAKRSLINRCIASARGPTTFRSNQQTSKHPEIENINEPAIAFLCDEAKGDPPRKPALSDWYRNPGRVTLLIVSTFDQTR